MSRGAEALRRLKPDEAKALMLKAEGHSYKEISDQLGWTYTKTNRAITEGRARFLKVFAEIETGAECERVAPTLAALVGGTATADALLELRPHLQHCTTCRATVRSLHESRLGRLAALWPIPAVLAPLRWVQGRIGATTDPTTVVPQLERAGDDDHPIVLSPVEGVPDLPEAVRRIDSDPPSSSATNASSTSSATSSSGGSACRAATSRPPRRSRRRTAAVAVSRRSARSSASASAASARERSAWSAA